MLTFAGAKILSLDMEENMRGREDEREWGRRMNSPILCERMEMVQC